MLLKFFTRQAALSLFKKSSQANINLLDIGCSNFVPIHFCKYSKYINYIGCDPDPVGKKNTDAFLCKTKFKTSSTFNVGASDRPSKSFLQVAKKRTGSKITIIENEQTIEVKLVQTNELQKKFQQNFFQKYFL